MLKTLISKFRKPKEEPKKEVPMWEFETGPKTMVAGDVLNLMIFRVEGDDIKCSFAAIHTCTVKGVEDIIAEVDKGSLVTQTNMLTLYVWLANTKGRTHDTEILGFVTNPNLPIAQMPCSSRSGLRANAVRTNGVCTATTAYPSETVLRAAGRPAPRDSDRA